MPNEVCRRHIAIIVLGDIGRSPRMQYHARSLLEQGHYVSLVGYTGEDLIPDLSEDKYINADDNLLNIIRFEPYSPPKWLRKYKVGGKIPIGMPVYLVLRLIGLVFGLVYILWFRLSKFKNRTISVDCILVQNPPSIPLLLLSYCYCISHTNRISSPRKKLIRPGLVIDWHNIGYTMFDTSPNHPIKRIAKYYEQKIAPLSSGNLCVTKSMKDFLISKFNVSKEKINVLHDRPPEFFRPSSLERKHELMMKLRDDMEIACPELKKMRLRCNVNNSDNNEEINIFTKKIICNGKNVIVAQDCQPALLISSTSWTPDEDFSILLDALVDLNEKLNVKEASEMSFFPHIVLIVTGKGPQKEMYQSKITKLKLKHISIITMWLEAIDYPVLLGCADLGVSLHTSTSGLDLPMKIYDFFGCEVPVCAISFSCLTELVQDDVNGRIFEDSYELSNQIFELFNDKKRGVDNKLDGALKTYRNNIRDISRWRENWIENALDMILAACPTSFQKSKND